MQQRLSSVFLFRAKVLADIELAQNLKSETEKAQEEMIETVPHPLDQDYTSLRCRLSLLDTKTEIFKVQSNAKLLQYMATPGMTCRVLRLCCSSAQHKATFIVFIVGVESITSHFSTAGTKILKAEAANDK